MKPPASPASRTRPTPGTTSVRAEVERRAGLALHALAELGHRGAQDLEQPVRLLPRALGLGVEDGADQRVAVLRHDVAVAERVAELPRVDAVEVGLDLAVELHVVLQGDVGAGGAHAEPPAHRGASAVGADEVRALKRHDTVGGLAVDVDAGGVLREPDECGRPDDLDGLGQQRHEPVVEARAVDVEEREGGGLADAAVPVDVAEVHVARGRDDALGDLAVGGERLDAEFVQHPAAALVAGERGGVDHQDGAALGRVQRGHDACGSRSDDDGVVAFAARKSHRCRSPLSTVHGAIFSALPTPPEWARRCAG